MRNTVTNKNVEVMYHGVSKGKNLPYGSYSTTTYILIYGFMLRCTHVIQHAEE